MKKFYFILIALCFFATTKAQIVNIPDANFLAVLLSSDYNNGNAQDLSGNNFKIDTNNDGKIQITEALQVSSLMVYYSVVSSLEGIQEFKNLQKLDCNGTQIQTLNLSGLNKLNSIFCIQNLQLETLDLSGVTELKNLYCTNNRLTSLNLSGLTNIENLQCYNNQLNSLDLTGLVKLKDLICGYNQLTTLTLNGLIALQGASCDFNQLTTLNAENLPNLTTLTCTDNLLTALNINGSHNIQKLFCQNNKLNTLNTNDQYYIQDLDCSFNLLNSLFIKNAITGWFLNFQNNPNLRYICVNEGLTGAGIIRDKINKYGNTNCVLSSYCTFSPSGEYYIISGKTKFDNDNNGCNAPDKDIQNFKLNISNGSISGKFISNISGNYSIPVQAGIHIITPVIENPTYFNVSPATATFTFPTQISPFTQNFCVTANGIHPDLEITLLPLLSAVSGFDAEYKIVYKNKGTITETGSINLNFSDAVLDFVAANPVTSNQTTNNLSWDFTNLLPFETREITFTLNVNSPMETPAVNGGDILAFIATITSAATDEKPIDNTFAFNQIVLNSFDPNDKTCLEGTTISPALIGQYVHYMIRFENNGTANAQNIVVKDMIDLTKFDISTLIPTNASHSFVTNITAGNKVEFIFENINLPFDDANNDGYIAFKIKTLPTLKVGDTFTNDASIYFDYNFPIVTNKATSTFKTLGTQDFEFSNYFMVYPNPANEVLNISSKEGIEMKSISIYNTLGQLVLVIPNAEKVSKIDVSNLTTGNYFIKVNSDKGTSNTRFIKE